MNKTILMLAALCAITVSCAHGMKGSERNPQASTAPMLMDEENDTDYDVMFTDPLCGNYKYTGEVTTAAGKKLVGKPKDVYCKSKYDLSASGKREVSPQFRLVKWVNDPSTKEIIFTYLSFRNSAVKNALCDRVKAGSLKVTFVMSSSEDTTAADYVKSCNPDMVEYKTRGLEGDLGYAHNKIFIVLQKSIDYSSSSWRAQLGKKDRIKIAFSSGNLTSGPVMHHENWHFIETNAATHFAQMHMCVLNSEWDEVSGRSRKEYMAAIVKCRQDLVAEGKPQESDIHVFFVPGEGEDRNGKLDNGTEGDSAATHMVYGANGLPGIRNATKIWIGAHRFFYSRMINELRERLNSSNKPQVRIIVDDDTYYKAMDPGFAFGDTMPEEWFNIQDMMDHGAEARLMETNSEEHQLHHSKYLIFHDSAGPKAVLCGAANLTGAGFKKNWENIYYIMIPQVAQAFADHYEKFWSEDSFQTDLTNKASPIISLPKEGTVSDRIPEKGE